jgi:hypothetical protein
MLVAATEVTPGSAEIRSTSCLPAATICSSLANLVSGSDMTGTCKHRSLPSRICICERQRQQQQLAQNRQFSHNYNRIGIGSTLPL